MLSAKYREQVELLLKLLPHAAVEETLALKGGTAINLFVWDMPRLSVDIDLTYIPASDNRETALHNISAALQRIEENVKRMIPGISVTHIPHGQGDDVKLNCQLRNAHVKIEVNTTTRGILFPTRRMVLSEVVQSEFKLFAAMNVVSHGELFGGKICAALDRQHPRDLFDIHNLFSGAGFSVEVKLGFMMFLVSHYRPIQDLVFSHPHDQEDNFEKQFAGMTTVPFNYTTFQKTRTRLTSEIHRNLTQNEKQFLISFEQGEPEWKLIDLPNLRNLPAVKWKLLNIHKLREDNPRKHAMQLAELTEKFASI
jgi:predicted nucleotidyltransferase component of viral defense system